MEDSLMEKRIDKLEARDTKNTEDIIRIDERLNSVGINLDNLKKDNEKNFTLLNANVSEIKNERGIPITYNPAVNVPLVSTVKTDKPVETTTLAQA